MPSQLGRFGDAVPVSVPSVVEETSLGGYIDSVLDDLTGRLSKL